MEEYISHGLYESMAMYLVSFCALVFWNKIAPRDLAFVSVAVATSSLQCPKTLEVELCSTGCKSSV